MRDLIVTLIVFGSLPAIVWRPYIGIYMWAWIGYMNPHRLTYGFAFTFPFAQFIGAATLLGTLFTKERRLPPLTALTFVWILFVLWMNLTTLFALNPADAELTWAQTMKIQLMSFVTIMLIFDRRRLDVLVAVIAFSIGFYGVKGGVFTLLTGGEQRVFGPYGTFIYDNNDLALALIMTLPLVRYLQLQATRRWQSWALLACMLLMILSIFATHSRGALLGMCAMALVLWWRSRQKVRLAALFVLMIPFILWFMPDRWFERMATIRTYEEDPSAMGRINAWWFAYNVAREFPITGGGFDVFTEELFLRYAPDPLDFHDSHSIYFEVLGEHGFVGLGLFLLLGALALLTAGRVYRRAKGDPDLMWARDLAGMLQVSLVGYAVCGAFLGRAYFDLYFNLIALIVILRSLVPDPKHATKAAGAQAPLPAPEPRRLRTFGKQTG